MRPRLLSLAERLGFSSPPDAAFDRTRRRGPKRLVASGLLASTGLLLLVPNMYPLLRGAPTPIATVLSVLGSAVSAGLVAAGYLLYRSRFSDRNAVRIAAWNVLGVVVLGLVMLGHAASQGAVPNGLDTTTFVVANLVAIAAAAHVVIGVYDARRVRAEQLARERRRIAVLNRVLRHNLRHEAQVLSGYADIVAGEAGANDRLASSAATVKRSADTVGSLADDAKVIMQAQERGPDAYEPTDAEAVLGGAVDDVRSDSPSADVTVRAPDESVSVLATGDLRRALSELVENAVEHGSTGDSPSVDASVRPDGDAVEFRVVDGGPGIPDHERAVVNGDAEITQLTHGSGLGLWVAEAVAESHGGELTLAEGDADGAVVTLSVPRA